MEVIHVSMGRREEGGGCFSNRRASFLSGVCVPWGASVLMGGFRKQIHQYVPLNDVLTHFMPLVSCFQGVSKEISGMKWVDITFRELL